MPMPGRRPVPINLSDKSLVLVVTRKGRMAVVPLDPVALLAASAHSRVLLCRGAGGAPLVLKATRLDDPPTAERARREITLAARDCGPFVVRSLGWLSTPSEVYLRMDYAPGGDVELLIDREGSLSPSAARFYAGCLALALEALHALGVLHRDVKPGNLVIGGECVAGTEPQLVCG